MHPVRTSLAFALLAALASPAVAAPSLDPGSDPHTRPQDDLFRAVNGGWLDAAQIPGDKKAYGTFMILRENSNADVRVLLEEAAKHPGTNASTQLVGPLYAALNDLNGIEKAGLTPLKGELAAIDGCKDIEALTQRMAALQLAGVSMPVNAYTGPDAKAPDMNAVYWAQGGLGLPNRDYYTKQDAASKTLRTEYVAYLTELAHLAGDPAAAKTAATTMALETALATVQWTSVERRDAVKTYNPAPRDTWATAYAGFPWELYAAALGMPAGAGSIVSEPTYVKAFAAMAGHVPVEQWQGYMRLRLLDESAENLPKAFREAHYHFKSEKLAGLTAEPPRWRTAVETVDALVGEAVGAAYVAKHFPPSAKKRMQSLVGNLLACYRDALGQLPWMAPETRTEALSKLAKLRVKIGYPDKWRGYAGLELKPGDALGDILTADRFLSKRDMAEAGKPVDRSRWDMTPQTVNAYYSPVGNEIVFPAAILQPPFFDPKADDAYNYGAIGAVIGHETSHGFDDQGRRYDASGKLRDWWTPADEKNFMERASRLAAQYSGYEPLPGLHVDGKLTLGENIADLAGLTMALNAYHRSLHGHASPVIGGLTGEQRFFIGFARVWRSKSRSEWLRQRLVMDPHSPEQYRTNGVASNMDAFYKAFDVKPGDKMYKLPADRVHIW